ncbi:MAG TPA: DegQ family serine endoprotease [Verrucomicrobiae bacterium]|nr:DegQ family serine endoprotease [Verrucomicrobiae bacterium]
MKRLFGFRAPFLMAVVLGFAGACSAKTNVPPHLVIDDAALKPAVKAKTSFAPMVKHIIPSVVTIYSTMTVKEPRNPFSEDPFLRRFFGGGDDDNQQPQERQEHGLGSGVIVSSDGYILTANHVVEGATTVRVALAGGNDRYDAKIVGTDPPTDVAVLKIDVKHSLSPITVGDSDKLEVGDTVLAVGNPFSVGETVTMGIVSGLERGFGITSYENFIQTDAAINPGNSGGALVDAEGRLVGINTAILSKSGGFMGVGFAVPINLARFVMNKLITEGKVSRGFLGIHIQSLTPDLARAFDLPDESSGVLVGGVEPGSAADKAGVKNGDVIIDFNGKKVTDARALRLAVSETAPGSKIKLRVLRGENGRKPSEKTLTATLAEYPKEGLAGNLGPNGHERGQSSTDALDGVEVTDLDARTRHQLGIPSSVHGALVTSVDQNSNSAEAGLREGDVIMEINRQPVKSADEAVALSEKAKGDRILLRVWTAGGEGSPGGTHYLVDNTKRK